MQTPHSFLPDTDLTETQRYVTIQTYDRFASIYAQKWEWNPKTIREIKKYNIMPFCKYAKKGGNVLIVGSFCGRDYHFLTNNGYACVGVEPSFGLLIEALRRVPNGLFLHRNLQLLPFMPESFDAVYADALTSIPKKKMKETIKDFTIFLRKKGILYLSLKLGKTDVILMDDLGGKRYFTLFTEKEIRNIISSCDLTILWSATSDHTDPTLPQWFSLIAKKT